LAGVGGVLLLKIEGIFFDLDGTLLDTSELIYRSFEYTLNYFGFPQLKREELLSFWGEPLAVTAKKFLPQEPEKWLKVYRQYMFENHDRLVKPFDGAPGTLKKLKETGIPMGIITSKIRKGAMRGLKTFGLDKFFEVVVAADDVALPKPNPEPLLKAAEILNIKPSYSLMVGDTLYDVQCAKNAGALSAAVGWSECADKLKKAPYDYWLESFGDLIKLLKEKREGEQDFVYIRKK